MRVLVIGASGFLGSKLFVELGKKHEVFGTYLSSAKIKDMTNTCKLDLRNKSNIDYVLKKQRPELIADCSGLTKTDLCERERELAYETNVKGVKNLCDIASCKIVYFSTDFVFDGKKGLYSEVDLPNPINFYGLTKLLAEKIVLSSDSENLVVRVSGLFGLSKINDKFIQKMKERYVSGCIDLFSSPTYADDVCLNFGILAEHAGLLHFGGPERLSRYDMIKITSEILGINCTPIPVSSKEMRYIAPRPKDTSLKSSFFNPKKTKIRESLAKMREELNERIS